MVAWNADARYTRLIEQHGESLLHLAALLTGNRHDAEDVVQDTLITVAHAWPTAKPASGLAYLRRSVTNRAIDLARSRRETPTDELPDRAVEDHRFLRFDEDRRFFALVAVLPVKQRAAIILRYYADMPDRDIAAAVGSSVATVRSQIHHALAKLRELESGREGRD